MMWGCGGGGGPAPPGPAPTPDVIVQGYVKQSHNQSGVAGATVTVGGQSDTTDSNGYYRITGVSTGNHQVAVTPPGGYSPAAPVPAQQVSSGTNTIPDIYLVRNNLAPPAPPSL